MKARPSLFVSRWLPEGALDVMRSRFELCVNEKEEALSGEELARAIAGKDALLCCVSDKINQEVIERGDRLRVIAMLGAACDNIDVAFATQKGIQVLVLPDALTEATADLAWALLLAVARQIIPAAELIRSGRWQGWDPRAFFGHNVSGKTLGIVGFGRIGQAVARRASGFNMKVLYYDRTRKGSGIEKGLKAKYVSLDELLAASDFVSLNSSLTPESRHLIGKRELGSMQLHAYLINTGRGALVDEKALLAALRQKKIAGAALDVFEDEPRVNPGFLELPNVICTPHIGTALVETRLEMARVIAQDIMLALEGKTPSGAVNHIK
ncbi:MAG: D-glycerate dehydrogenase [Dehalococcoidia bacterium]|nr:D-glycerate dehydrogenase [Dehalococcoidia bacterium]